MSSRTCHPEALKPASGLLVALRMPCVVIRAVLRPPAPAENRAFAMHPVTHALVGPMALAARLMAVARSTPAAPARRAPVPPLAAATEGGVADDTAVQSFDAADFEAAINGDTPVLVHYYAAWCGLCRLTDLMVAALAKEYEGRLQVQGVEGGGRGCAAGLGLQRVPTPLLRGEDTLCCNRS